MTTSYILNGMSIEEPKDEKLLLDFLDETRLEIKQTGSKKN